MIRVNHIPLRISDSDKPNAVYLLPSQAHLQHLAPSVVSFPTDVVESQGPGQGIESIEFPDRVLRNFDKVSLDPGETRIVNMTLTRKDLSYWSVRAQNWVLPTENSFRIWAGSSSRDLPLMAEF